MSESFVPKPIPWHALVPKSDSDILKALNAIGPGQVVIYHRGQLANDRTKSRMVDLIAKRAWTLAVQDEPSVCLVCYTPGIYAAIGASRRKELVH